MGISIDIVSNVLNVIKPLIVVPSSYNKTKEKELIKHGVKVVIYANQLLRSSYPAMVKTAKSILKNLRSYESTKNTMSQKIK